jgi:hypothetical protein
MGKLPSWFEGLFRQAEIISKKGQDVILISKKGKATVSLKRTADHKETDKQKPEDIFDEETDGLYRHNKQKNYILQEGTLLPFLQDLGVMTKDGAIVKAKMDKFRQINRFLEYIDDILPYLDSKKELTVLDFGCGKSYLTFESITS